MGRPPLRLGRPKGRPQAPFQPSHENRYPFTNWSTFAPPKWSKFTPPLTRVALVAPSLFTFEFGGGRVVGLNVKVNESDGVVNGSIAQPEGAFPGVASHPAPLGGVVTLFANALGPVEPVAISGQDSIDALRTVTTPVRVFVGDAEAQVLFAGLAPQFVGLYQINISIPLGAVPGDAVPIRIEQGGVVSRIDVTVAIRQ